MENEKIGKILLDYSLYPGEDFYCDGDIEQEILEEVKKITEGVKEFSDENNAEDGKTSGDVEDCKTVGNAERFLHSAYSSLIEEKANWPFLYHLSPIRENIVSWLPADKKMKVLEVGSGCGAITGALSKMAGSVECVDLSRQRSLINAYRHKDCDNVVIHVGNFQDIEPTLSADFDLICLIGVFEYGKAYIGGEAPYETFLNILKKHLTPGGRIAIAIENKFGLKYFAGCKEDHVGKYFEGIEDYPGETPARTFTKRGLLEIAAKCGFSPDQCHMYYPYPDYKFMHSLFSDERLPEMGELKDNLRNFDRDRLYLFDEKLVFENILREGEFPLFSNSYMLILGEKPMVTYARFSNDRADEKCIVTEMVNGKEIIKRALTDAAKEHLRKMAENYGKLCCSGNKSVSFAESADNPGEAADSEKRFAICPCRLNNDGSEIFFPVIPGKRLEELLDEKLFKGDKEGFIYLFKEYFERVKACEGGEVSNLDLIFSNILVSGDHACRKIGGDQTCEQADGNFTVEPAGDSENKAIWTAIDYEWVVSESVPAKEIAYRALYCYMLEDPRRLEAEEFGLLKLLGISADEAERFKKNELSFQKNVTGGHRSLAEIREKIGNEVIDVTGRMSGNMAGGSGASSAHGLAGKLKVYFDDGSGFSEEKSFYPDRNERGYEIDFSGRSSLRALRLDPCDYPSIVKIIYLTDSSGNDISKNITYSSGTRIGDNVYAFGTDDPFISIGLKNLSGSTVKAGFEISPLPKSIAASLHGPKESNIFEKIGRKLKG